MAHVTSSWPLLGPCFLGVRKLVGSVSQLRHMMPLREADGVFADFAYSSEDGQTKDACIRRCFVASGRGKERTLERDGFALSTLPFHKTSGFDLYDPSQCSEALYPLAEEVLRRAFPSSTRVLVFDHIARNVDRYMAETNADQKSTTPMLAPGPAISVHGDYTVRSGYTRSRSLLEPWESEERINKALEQRFAFVNVWVPLKKVQQNPLGMVEWSSQRPRDVVNLKFIYSHRVGEIYRVLPSEQHRWVYYKDMEPGECLLLKVFDSADDGRARFSLHAAFHDPTAAADAPSRESIELRCIVFFGDLPAGFGDSFIAPHLLPNSPDQEVAPKRVEASLPSDEW
mmetsp:Transcript_104952/g.301758  ORF Transcript_104952/g.301758 Transcript_104952/m.301758 type:complete len:342 (+) Transcript_104952:71-1096(+)